MIDVARSQFSLDRRKHFWIDDPFVFTFVERFGLGDSAEVNSIG